MLKFVNFAVLLLAVTVGTNVNALEVLCEIDGETVAIDEVRIVNAKIVVEPTGEDDTANLQCALDQASRLKVSTVELQEGAFNVSSVTASDWRGTLKGLTRETTTINTDEFASDSCDSEQGTLNF